MSSLRPLWVLVGQTEKNSLLPQVRAAVERHPLHRRVDFYAFATEGEGIDLLQAAATKAGGVVLLSGALVGSVALRDAVGAVSPLPVVEVRQENDLKRHEALCSPIAGAAGQGLVAGLGLAGVMLAVSVLAARLWPVPPATAALLPCPCCGGEARLAQWRDTASPNASWVECAECGLATADVHDEDPQKAKALAVALWNRRPPADVNAEIDAALKAVETPESPAGVPCPKCEGAGWLCWDELEHYSGPAIQTGVDDTRYTCDRCGGKRFVPKEQQP